MFYSHQLLARKAPLGQIWMAATMHAKMNRKKLNKLNIIKICEEILNPQVPMALRLSGILMGGVVIVYERKVKLLFDDVSRLLVEINEAWKIKPVNEDPTVLPKAKSQAKFEAVTLPDKNREIVEEIERSLNASSKTTTIRFEQTRYIHMRLDSVDDPVINDEIPREEDLNEQHHQADAANITLLDPIDSYQPDAFLYDRFDRFDIEGDDETQTNFTTQDNSIIPSLIPSPLHHEVPQQVDEIQDLFPEPQNNHVSPEQKNSNRSDESREEAQQPQPNEQKPRAAKRKVLPRAGHPQLDYEQTIIPGPLYQSWLQKTADIVTNRGGTKRRIIPISTMKTAHLMELPPGALLSGFSGFGSTEIHYPRPLLDLHLRSAQHRTPHDSPSRRNSSPQPPVPSSPSKPPFNQNPVEFSVEDFHSGVGSHPEHRSIERQMDMNMDMDMNFPVNEFNQMFTPGNSVILLEPLFTSAISHEFTGSNERSIPSSGSGNGLLHSTPVEQQRSSLKRGKSSSKHGTSGLDPVAEEESFELLTPNFKLRRVSEDEPSHDQEMLIETGPTQTPLPIFYHPMDKTTDSVRKHLKTHFDTVGATEFESLNQLSDGMNQAKAAKLFYQICVLATRDFLKVKQTKAYGDILIFKGSKM
ncbi:hypothetical protein IFM89_012866 [Coptis chinensis]|uniref:Sister chromatid cohesion 1 protein 1 n=1 Tax=Coptis chinensis TaxID=261450 RepID=A0A835HE31_9MAGN|nr:hypothetical protein IFM89_012866 [Coptis chinensis]